jgi:hypothetical protein
MNARISALGIGGVLALVGLLITVILVVIGHLAFLPIVFVLALLAIIL